LAKQILIFGEDIVSEFLQGMVTFGMTKLTNVDFAQINEFTDQVPVAQYKQVLK